MTATTHPGLGPDGQPATHHGLQGLCPAPERRASGAIALALTIQQPWADAIAQDPDPYQTAKRTENRGVLTDVQRLPRPIAARGAQKLWRPTPELVAAVRAQVDTLTLTAQS